MLIKINDNFYIDWEKILAMGAIHNEYSILINGVKKPIIISAVEYKNLRSQIDNQVFGAYDK